jgi:serine/threonine protein kinase/Tol biopolymer transport system component
MQMACPRSPRYNPPVVIPSLAPGTRLGPYEVVAAVAAGGMGHVYRAVDTRLDRHVAIKVLPPEFAADPQLRQRFDREARIVGSLNHPNICVLYDLGEQDSVAFLVMEFLEGETLAARLARGQLPTEEVFQYAIEIADALDRAHRHGVIHRDLKPGNVMLTRTGTKLLDFGLARAPVEEIFGGDTRAPGETPITALGTLVGTLQYMAPEQLEGRPIDTRTDLFALGALVYEMATGERAFPGQSQASIIAGILNHTPPPPSTLQPLTPPALDHIVGRCLAKDPDDRWQTARDIVVELRTRRDEPRGPVLRAAATLPPIGWLLAGLVVAAILGVTALSNWLAPASTSDGSVRALIAPPDRMLYQLTGDFAGPPVVAPDGRSLVFAAVDSLGKRRLWIRRLDALTPEPLPATDDATFPFWSPDGRSVAFFAEGRLKRLDLDGGSALALCNALGGRGGSWNRQGTIVFSPGVRGGLQQVPASGGVATPLTSTEGTPFTSHRWPQVLPDGRHFLYLAVQSQEGHDQSAVYLGSLTGREPRLLVRAGSQALYAAGHLLFLRDLTLWAQPFDPESAVLSGAPIAVARDVMQDPTIWRGIFDVNESGVLVYQSGQPGTSLTLYDREGHEIGPVGERGIMFDVNVSHDGEHVAVNRGEPADIWVYELGRGTGMRLTFDARNETLPIWSPDGRSIVYARIERDGKAAVMEAPAGGGESRQLLPPGDDTVSDWSSDGKYLLLRQGEMLMSPGDIWVADAANPSAAHALLVTPFAEYHAQFSPDDRWISYVSNESGRDEVYIMPFRPVATTPPPRSVPGRVRVSTGGGVLPRWRQDGSELFYLAPDMQLIAAEIQAKGDTLAVRQLKPLLGLHPKPVGWVYDVMPNGQKFIVNSLGDEGRRPLVLVTRWIAATQPGGR